MIADDGSVQNLNIPDHAKKIYKTAFEVSLKTYIEMAAERGRFIDQTQSLNLYVKGGDQEIANKLYSAICLGHKLGNKTLIYYARIFTPAGNKIREKSFKEIMAEIKEKSADGCSGGACSS